ncbi:hypothetical protein FNT36_16220 [Hymenobacter setariae]|uniref:Uncharacterized protein n=1 Tax=Hymenobacter setariae TaxID=2594794 RepID=A0A558BRR6_9BACT|nr:hypothetical protein [Hymenobacter setariae]TVT39204.1 hypothetical protein FNT36_16220 [Hymenobacter setariae]
MSTFLKENFMSSIVYRIGQDGYVYPSDKVIPVKTLYFIETVLIPEKTTLVLKREYYTAYLQDPERQRVTGNVLEWQGIRCRIEERDGWASDSDKKDFGLEGIVLIAHITDRRNRQERLLFTNNWHDGAAWNQLMAYVRDLAGVERHEHIFEARQLRLRIS